MAKIELRPIMTSAPIERSASNRAPTVTIVLTLLATVVTLRVMGRLWWCDCGEVILWTRAAFGRHTSQHLADPYAFTHVLHGFVIWWALCGLQRVIPVRWWMAAGIAAEALWEIVENSPVVIERYRATTAAVGYLGDTVINSLGDIVCCCLGILLAGRLGGWRSVLLFAATEIVLLCWIRDSLVMNVVMLLWPSDALQQWQLGS